MRSILSATLPWSSPWAGIAPGEGSADLAATPLQTLIAMMDPSAALPEVRSQKPTWAKAAGLARDWKLNRLTERLLLPIERNAV
jgi:hypothetical protein